VLVKEFLREDELDLNTAQSFFFNHSKISFKEGRIKITGKFSFAFWSGSSI